jgi:hypothetical protein
LSALCVPTISNWLGISLSERVDMLIKLCVASLIFPFCDTICVALPYWCACVCADWTPGDCRAAVSVRYLPAAVQQRVGVHQPHVAPRGAWGHQHRLRHPIASLRHQRWKPRSQCVDRNERFGRNEHVSSGDLGSSSRCCSACVAG